MIKIIILILQLLFSIGAVVSACRWLDHMAVKESRKMPTKLKTNKDFADGYEEGRADAVEEFRTYLKSVIPIEMPQEIWNMGVDNTCDRMLKGVEK